MLLQDIETLKRTIEDERAKYEEELSILQVSLMNIYRKTKQTIFLSFRND